MADDGTPGLGWGMEDGRRLHFAYIAAPRAAIISVPVLAMMQSGNKNIGKSRRI